jgi:hypothetical protein
MKVTLVNPPKSLYDQSELSPPLGLMRLAGVARAAGAEVVIIDFNLLYHLEERLQGETFYEAALVTLLEEESDVYGFTSMAVDSHVGIHLARLIKQALPLARTVLGGAHFSSIAEEVLAAYPWVDFVVKGEGEGAFGDLIKDESELAGRSAQAILSSATPHELPPSPPAYDLIDLEPYFAINRRRCMDFEGGRGCRFKCSFCYSPGHYNATRDFDIDENIAGLERLRRLGAKHVFFIEDNFLNDPARAIAFCRDMEAARLGLTWHCYATFPQMSAEVIMWMARAGCTAVFTGIDAVGGVSQRAYQKGFLRHKTSLERKLVECVDAGIVPTCAFLLSPPSHTCGVDIEETVSAALVARNCGAQVRLNTLTLYNSTKSRIDVKSPCHYDDFKPRLMLDVPEVVERNDYARALPTLFPFHSRYVARDEWEAFVSLGHCLFTLFYCYPRTLDALWAEKSISPCAVSRKVLEEVGNLLEIEKPLRRDAELAAAIPILEGLTATSKWTQSVLEAESCALITV